jgi:hypothetical protein
MESLGARVNKGEQDSSDSEVRLEFENELLGWLHCGDTVKKGVKYSLRNDLMYRWISKKEIE